MTSGIESSGATQPQPVAVVLAAGKGTRMKSPLPKVLHELDGTPLVLFPIRAACVNDVARVVVVVGHDAERVRSRVAADAEAAGYLAQFALQAEQNGTGHAVLCALPEIADHDGPVLILSGDVPLLRAETLGRLRSACASSPTSVAFVTFSPPDATGYGRVVRDADGAVVAIREHRDASPEERAIGECNGGVYCIGADVLRRVLPSLGTANDQGEIYLTDVVAEAARGGAVATVSVEPLEVAGVNTPEQLAALEDVLHARGRARAREYE